MDKNSAGISQAKAVINSESVSLATLVKEATLYLKSRGNYSERVAKYIVITWLQFEKHCEAKGFETYLPECRESFIQSLHNCTPPLKPETIRIKENNLRMLDLYFRNGAWEKGVLDPKPELNEEFANFITAQDEYLKKRHYSDFSRETIREQTYVIFRFFQKIGIQDISSINADSISDYVLSLKGHARSTLRCELSRLRQILRNAYLLEYVITDMSVYVPTFKLGQTQSKVKIWESEEIDKVLETVDRSNPKGLRDAAYITIAAELGMRSRDILNLKLDDFDWEACSLTFIQSKTGKANTLPINEKVGTAIIDYLRVRPNTDCEYLFVNLNPPFGKMKSFNASFCRYVNRSGVSLPVDAHHGLHSLRATIATKLLEANVDPDNIVAIVGHSDRESLHHYIRLDIEHLRECALSFEGGEFV